MQTVICQKKINGLLGFELSEDSLKGGRGWGVSDTIPAMRERRPRWSLLELQQRTEDQKKEKHLCALLRDCSPSLWRCSCWLHLIYRRKTLKVCLFPSLLCPLRLTMMTREHRGNALLLVFPFLYQNVYNCLVSWFSEQTCANDFKKTVIIQR